MSRRSPTGFVFSVAAEVIAVVFIVSVLPRVDLRHSAGAAPSSAQTSTGPTSLLPLPGWGQAADNRPSPPAFETSYYQRRTQPDPPREPSHEREFTPLITVDPAKPGYVEQRLDRASQDLVNTVGSYVSQAATDLLQVPPPAAAQRLAPPQSSSPAVPRLSSSIPPLAPSFLASPPTSGSFPTQSPSPSQAQPRPWMRY
jgi:hypothetical protein